MYRSKFYIRNLELEIHKREMEEAKSELKQLLREKKKSYARYVSDIHKPTPSFHKAKELENLKDRIKHPVRQGKKFSPGANLPLLPRLHKNRSYQHFDDDR